MNVWMRGIGLGLLGLVLSSLVTAARVEADPFTGETAEKYTCIKEADGGGFICDDLGSWETQKGHNYTFEATSDDGALTLEVWLVSPNGGTTRVGNVGSHVVQAPSGTTNRARFSFHETDDERSYLLVVRSEDIIEFTMRVIGPAPN